MEMKLLALCCSVLVQTNIARLTIRNEKNRSACLIEDQAHRTLIQTELVVSDILCEEMCKNVGLYPTCPCPGFEGQPASEGDSRKCANKYCQDPRNPCPTEAFVTCVRETTQASLMQWNDLLDRVGTTLSLHNYSHRIHLEDVNASSCQVLDKKHRSFLQAQLTASDVLCEDMCKSIGVWPKCPCAGFEGNPASNSDTRKCIKEHCQSPKVHCPTDAFLTCVDEATKLSVLQWDALLQGVESYLRQVSSIPMKLKSSGRKT